MTLTADHLAWQQRVFKETNAGSKFLDLERHTIRSTSNFYSVASQFDPDVGTSNPNNMRDKRVLEIKAKHNFYVMPTFNKNNLRLNTKKYKNEFDNETLTLYSGGGYIAKSRLASSYSK